MLHLFSADWVGFDRKSLHLLPRELGGHRRTSGGIPEIKLVLRLEACPPGAWLS